MSNLVLERGQMSQPPPLDSVSVATTVAAAFMGDVVGPYVGTYAIILMCFVPGAVFGVYRRDPESRLSVFAFVLSMLFITLAITVFLAQYLSDKTQVSVGALEAAIAFLIPTVGEDWFKLIKAGIGWVLDFINSKKPGQS